MMVVLGEEEHSGSIHHWLTAYFATVELLKENVKIRKKWENGRQKSR